MKRIEEIFEEERADGSITYYGLIKKEKYFLSLFKYYYIAYIAEGMYEDETGNSRHNLTTDKKKARRFNSLENCKQALELVNKYLDQRQVISLKRVYI